MASSRRKTLTFLAMLAPALAGCGGGGGGGIGVASTPTPPPPPPPPAPPPSAAVESPFQLYPTGTYAAYSATYDAVTGAAQTDAPGTLSIAIDTVDRTYTLTTTDQRFLTSPATFNPTPTSAPSNFGGYYDSDTSTLANGATATDSFYTFYRPAGELRYSSLATWSHTVILPTDDPSEPSTSLNHSAVYGLRTPASSLPATGIATYTTTNGGLFTADCDCFGTATLSADFGAQIIAAQIRLFAFFISDRDFALTVNGLAPISANADFTMALNGSATVYPANGGATWTDPVSGSLIGAFFGPQAQEAGGAFSLTIQNSQTSVAGAFVAPRP